MFGRLPAVAPADVGDVAGDFDPPLHEGATSASAATTPMLRRRRLVLVVANARGTSRWSGVTLLRESSEAGIREWHAVIARLLRLNRFVSRRRSARWVDLGIVREP